MNPFRVSLVALAAALITFTPALAQRVQPQPKIALGRGETSLVAADAGDKLKLTGEQKEKYTKIDADYKDAVKKAQDKYREDVAGLNDRTKFKEVQEKLQADVKKVRDDSLAKVEPLLTAEQKATFTQVKGQPVQPGGLVRAQPIGGAGGIGQVLPPAVQNRLQLTEDQKKQIETLQKEVEAKILKVLSEEQ